MKNMTTKYWLLIVVELCSAGLLLIRADEALRVCLTELGCLQGTNMPGLRTEKFEAFLGIPFAKPPIGELRFQNPEPISAWSNSTLDATKSKPQCLQKNYFAPLWPISGDEDCLYLNLYRPLRSGQEDPLPVIFYIHGGCFIFGSIDPQLLGPEHFMDTGEVILVIAAFRLGPFGFLASGDEVMPGNFGLKDQNLALQWVNQHIAAFGGDPKKITIAGHSAGGSSVHFHMLYKLSKGLFVRAISMSGSALAPYVSIQTEPLQVATQLAQIAGIANATQLNTTELLSVLQSMDPLVILNAGDAFKTWFITPLVNFRPNIEQANWRNAFITEDPETRVNQQLFAENFFERPGKAPCTFVHIFENANVSMGVFVMRSGYTMPLHDHPMMHGILRGIHGNLKILSYTQQLAGPNEKLIYDKTALEIDVVAEETKCVSPETECAILTPRERNFHEITAVGGVAAFFDILSPPYDTKIPIYGTRKCRFYQTSPLLDTEMLVGTEEQLEHAQLTEAGTRLKLYCIPAPKSYYCDTAETADEVTECTFICSAEAYSS